MPRRPRAAPLLFRWAHSTPPGARTTTCALLRWGTPVPFVNDPADKLVPIVESIRLFTRAGMFETPTDIKPTDADAEQLFQNAVTQLAGDARWTRPVPILTRKSVSHIGRCLCFEQRHLGLVLEALWHIAHMAGLELHPAIDRIDLQFRELHPKSDYYTPLDDYELDALRDALPFLPPAPPRKVSARLQSPLPEPVESDQSDPESPVSLDARLPVFPIPGGGDGYIRAPTWTSLGMPPPELARPLALVLLLRAHSLDDLADAVLERLAEALGVAAAALEPDNLRSLRMFAVESAARATAPEQLADDLYNEQEQAELDALDRLYDRDPRRLDLLDAAPELGQLIAAARCPALHRAALFYKFATNSLFATAAPTFIAYSTALLVEQANLFTTPPPSEPAKPVNPPQPTEPAVDEPAQAKPDAK